MKLVLAALILALLYLIAGNIVGIYGGAWDATWLGVLCAPYAFVAGLSEFTSWDAMSFFWEVVIFVITVPFFYFFVLVATYVWRRTLGKPSRVMK